jgi:hypothetical protein
MLVPEGSRGHVDRNRRWRWLLSRNSTPYRRAFNQLCHIVPL